MAKLWLLDFDGTLVDSEKAIKACYIKIGQKLVPDRVSFIKTMIIGPTLDESSRMILTNKKIHLLESFKKQFQELYDREVILETKKYPNVNKTLNNLHTKGDHLFIITNKRSNPTHKLINYYGWNNYFSFIACADEYENIKHKSEIINLMKINYCNYDEIFLVGDTVNDGIAAKKNKIKFIKAEYGYGKDENWNNIPIYKSIKKFNELVMI